MDTAIAVGMNPGATPEVAPLEYEHGRPDGRDVIAGRAPLLPSGDRKGLELTPWATRLDEKNRDNAMSMEVAESIADGELPHDIARRLGVKRGQLMMWLRADPERYAMYGAALQARADELVLEGFQIVDATEGNPDGVASAKLRTDFRRWVSSKWDRSRFGEDAKGAAVNVGVRIVMSAEDAAVL